MGKIKNLIIEVANHYGIHPSEVDEKVINKYLYEINHTNLK